ASYLIPLAHREGVFRIVLIVALPGQLEGLAKDVGPQPAVLPPSGDVTFRAVAEEIEEDRGGTPAGHQIGSAAWRCPTGASP
ncbi:hypothetical protein B4Q13_23770, partial [Lacticaseibacillus rhamnosus]